MNEHDETWYRGYAAGYAAALVADGNPSQGGYVAGPDTKAMHTSVVLHHGERATSAAGVVHWWDATTRQWVPLTGPPKTTEPT